MSVIKFELKEGHVKLLKHLEWEELSSGNHINTKGENTPFGGIDHYEDMGVILYGQPEDFDPFEGNPFEWTEEQKNEMDELIQIYLKEKSKQISNRYNFLLFHRQLFCSDGF